MATVIGPGAPSPTGTPASEVIGVTPQAVVTAISSSAWVTCSFRPHIGLLLFHDCHLEQVFKLAVDDHLGHCRIVREFKRCPNKMCNSGGLRHFLRLDL
jgi:hypothetical protein